MPPLYWPGCATVADAWPPSFPIDSNLADWESPLTGSRALCSVSRSHSIPPDTHQKSVSLGY